MALCRGARASPADPAWSIPALSFSGMSFHSLVHEVGIVSSDFGKKQCSPLHSNCLGGQRDDKGDDHNYYLAWFCLWVLLAPQSQPHDESHTELAGGFKGDRKLNWFFKNSSRILILAGSLFSTCEISLVAIITLFNIWSNLRTAAAAGAGPAHALRGGGRAALPEPGRERAAGARDRPAPVALPFE